jgi:hypothetical protein
MYSVSSMIYGRPTGIPPVRVLTNQNSLPSPIDDKYISQGEWQPDNIPSLNAFFVNCVQLYRVMDEILERLQEALAAVKSDSEGGSDIEKQRGTQSCCSSAVTELAAILQLDGLLLKWHGALPEYLKFSLENIEKDMGYPVEIQRQRVILKIRFLGLRILLHRQTVVFLLQPPEQRKWPRNASQKWPPLFADTGGESFANGSESPGRRTVHSSLETQLAHLSAGMCVSSAQMQIEMIDYYRPLKLTGAWWWDFHCKCSERWFPCPRLNVCIVVFNSLCVLFGAVGFRKGDLAKTIPSLPEAKMIIERGFSNIHDMAARGGTNAARSERFLKRLMKTTLRRGQKVSGVTSLTLS